ncbi:LegC family aminotransferase [Thermodesulfovibrio sp.]|jgi:aminotransferase in exopolysaccharide biosynthesis|uniref:LegC family aminotransferase n=1 Tax=Thermodesulfovibrio sp. TaxID=2067987 RepID=UPI002634337D|nr:LegC family aminotransferase [Thermodesulfovibrio sp.]
MTKCSDKYIAIVQFIKELYHKDTVFLHEPIFLGNEKKYLEECIDSTFVSYVGEFVGQFEREIEKFTGTGYAIATVNGTAALHLALLTLGVKYGDEVITQPLTFVATANAIAHCGANPIFIDVDLENLGMSPESLKDFLKKYTKIKNRVLINKISGKRISAVVPVHVFGHPCKIDKIISISEEYGLPVVEDAAEALGSFYKGKHCGTFGIMGILSFNGNKIITTGGGGAILTDNPELAEKIRHLSTTAKVSHPYHYYHDEIGYNYRMPNINAAIGLAQIEYISKILELKRELALIYREFFNSLSLSFITEPRYAKSNYWLNAILFDNANERESFLEFAVNNSVQCRAAWRLISNLPMYEKCFKTELQNSIKLENTIANIPSGIPSRIIKK